MTTDQVRLRSGVTLTEVLISIFIMGIGLLSLLVLFPLGAINMAQSIKDDRTAHCGHSAASIARLWGIRDDSAVFPNYNGNTAIGLAPQLSTIPNYRGPSYPVYVDPLGAAMGSSTVGTLPVGMAASPGFARVSPSFVPASPPNLRNRAIARWFGLLDDLQFTDNGTPKTLGATVLRDTRYTWAYLCRQNQAYTTTPPPGPGPLPSSTPPAATPPHYPSPQGVDLTVVVYDRRPWLAGGEQVFDAEYGPKFIPPAPTPPPPPPYFGANIVQLNWTAGATPPSIRKGAWLLDASVLTGGQPDPQGFFYRVVSTTMGPGTPPTSMLVEVQVTFRKSALPPPPTGVGPLPGWPRLGVAVIMDNVVEVFDKGTAW